MNKTDTESCVFCIKKALYASVRLERHFHGHIISVVVRPCCGHLLLDVASTILYNVVPWVRWDFQQRPDLWRRANGRESSGSFAVNRLSASTGSS